MPEGTIALVGSDGVVVKLSRRAAMESGTLADWIEDCEVVEAAFPVTEGDGRALAAAAAICERAAARRAAEAADDDAAPSSEPAPAPSPAPAAEGEAGVNITSLTISTAAESGLFTLVRVAKFLDMPAVERHAADQVAAMLRNKSPDEMRHTLGVEADLSALEQAVALAEPLFTPPSSDEPALLSARAPGSRRAVPLGRAASYGGLLGDDDAIDVSLSRLDARSLRCLKGVSARWRQRARWVLHEPMSMWRAAPVWNAPEWSHQAVETGDFEALRALDASVELPAHAASLAAAIESRGGVAAQEGDWDAQSSRTRATALDLLAKLEPAVRVGAAVSLLGHPTPLVRAGATRLMHQLDASVLSAYADMSVDRLFDAQSYVRDAGSLVLRRLDTSILSRPAVCTALVTAIGNASPGTQTSALQALERVEVPALGRCAADLGAYLHHADSGVRTAAAVALRRMPSSTLREFAPTLARMLIPASNEAKEAMLTLSKLP